MRSEFRICCNRLVEGRANRTDYHTDNMKRKSGFRPDCRVFYTRILCSDALFRLLIGRRKADAACGPAAETGFLVMSPSYAWLRAYPEYRERLAIHPTRHCGQCVGADWCGPDQSAAAVPARRKIPQRQQERNWVRKEARWRKKRRNSDTRLTAAVYIYLYMPRCIFR